MDSQVTSAENMPAVLSPATNASTLPPATSTFTVLPATSALTLPPAVNSSTGAPAVNSSTGAPAVNSSTGAPAVNSSTGAPAVNSLTLPPAVNISTLPPTSSSDLPPATIEVLGDHLYDKIEELWRTEAAELDVGKLTGILLELGEMEVLRMLQEKSYLQHCILTAIQHVPSTCRGGPNMAVREHVEENEAEKLYERVTQLDPEHSAHITGMLLDLSPAQVSELLAAPSELQAAVTRAKATLSCSHFVPEHGYSDVPQHIYSDSPAHGYLDVRGHEYSNVSESALLISVSSDSDSYSSAKNGGMTAHSSKDFSSDSCAVRDDGTKEVHGGQNSSQDLNSKADLEELGERVYAEAEELYPQYAEKITGMLLEMGAEKLHALLNRDIAKLHRMLALAFESLRGPR